MISVRRAVFLSLSALLLTCLPGKTGDNRSQQKPIFKVGVDTVFLKVSVTDPLNRNVTGLSKEDFRVYEDKVEQEISTFMQEPSPGKEMGRNPLLSFLSQSFQRHIPLQT